MDEQLTFDFDKRPTIKGYPELRWTGKHPYDSTQYYPAQLRERYGEEVNGWINKIFWGDNLQVMSHLLKDFRHAIDCIYIDPPFDSKAQYKKTIKIRSQDVSNDMMSFEEVQYNDIWTNDTYLQFMYERFTIMRELLKDTGSLWVHCDQSRLLLQIWRTNLTFSFKIGFEQAKAFRHATNQYLRPYQWKDITVSVVI